MSHVRKELEMLLFSRHFWRQDKIYYRCAFLIEFLKIAQPIQCVHTPSRAPPMWAWTPGSPTARENCSVVATLHVVLPHEAVIFHTSRDDGSIHLTGRYRSECQLLVSCNWVPLSTNRRGHMGRRPRPAQLVRLIHKKRRRINKLRRY